ncbi:MAG: ABC transporter ATP-binding protein [Gemmatimonadaceae bacterium]
MTLALELSAISKKFGSVDALQDASIRVRPGTTHALLGENGAGKSTLMRIAFGLVTPDRGSIAVNGRPASFRSPADAMACGIGMVHQHFTLVPAMTVAENVALGMRGLYHAKVAAARVRDIGRRTGLELDPSARVADLPVSAQQRLEIVKALARDIRLLILDEPTAVLAPAEADHLLEWVARWVREGNAAILITHKLREARAIADDVTVLRRGRTVLADATEHADEDVLVHAMLGGVLARAENRESTSHLGAVVLRIANATLTRERGDDALRNASLEVHGGEIVGVAAVEGAGQLELLRLLAGRLTPARGTVHLPLRIAFIPEDRHRDALVLGMTLTENLALRGLGERRGTLPWSSLEAGAMATLERFDVRASSVNAKARELSGGNQQKLVLARELGELPNAVIAENPTRGLDIRASGAVHEQLRAARDAGCAVVVYSSDLDEVLALADRVVVVHAGEVRQVEGNRDDVGRAMLGAV